MEIKDSANSYERKDKKIINNFNFSLNNPNKKNLTFRKKKKYNWVKKIQKYFLTKCLDYYKSSKPNNYINKNYLTNNYLIIQPRNIPVLTELDYSKTIG